MKIRRGMSCKGESASTFGGSACESRVQMICGGTDKNMKALIAPLLVV